MQASLSPRHRPTHKALVWCQSVSPVSTLSSALGCWGCCWPHHLGSYANTSLATMTAGAWGGGGGGLMETQRVDQQSVSLLLLDLQQDSKNLVPTLHVNSAWLPCTLKQNYVTDVRCCHCDIHDLYHKVHLQKNKLPLPVHKQYKNENKKYEISFTNQQG